MQITADRKSFIFFFFFFLRTVHDLEVLEYGIFEQYNFIQLQVLPCEYAESRPFDMR